MTVAHNILVSVAAPLSAAIGYGLGASIAGPALGVPLGLACWWLPCKLLAERRHQYAHLIPPDLSGRTHEVMYARSSPAGPDKLGPISALKNLGWDKQTAQRKVEEAVQAGKSNDQDIIQYALRGR